MHSKLRAVTDTFPTTVLLRKGNIRVGDDVTLSCEAIDARGGDIYGYRWFKNGSRINEMKEDDRDNFYVYRRLTNKSRTNEMYQVSQGTLKIMVRGG